MLNVERTIANMHPANVLKRGYSITRLQGKAITSADQAHPADLMETILFNGSITSEIKSIKNTPDL